MKPVLFLDVDGVLSALRESPWAESVSSAVKVADYPHSFLINTSPLLGFRLQQLPVDIHWLTTWREDANTLISPLVGLPDDLPVVDWQIAFGEPSSIDGKRRAVEAWTEANPGHPYIWIGRAVPDRRSNVVSGPDSRGHRQGGAVALGLARRSTIWGWPSDGLVSFSSPFR
jgi:hypothetical protein